MVAYQLLLWAEERDTASESNRDFSDEEGQMATGIKCPKCGLMQIHRATCKACGAVMNARSSHPTASKSRNDPNDGVSEHLDLTEELTPSGMNALRWLDVPPRQFVGLLIVLVGLGLILLNVTGPSMTRMTEFWRLTIPQPGFFDVEWARHEFLGAGIVAVIIGVAIVLCPQSLWSKIPKRKSGRRSNGP